jgi:hypothetical protein
LLTASALAASTSASASAATTAVSATIHCRLSLLLVLHHQKWN